VLETEINLPFVTADASGPKHMAMKLTRAKLESLVEDLVQRTIAPLQQALADAGRLPGSRGEFTFRGGCTLVMDLETAEPRYFIRKNILSADRLERQCRWLAGPEGARLRATYFGGPTAAGRREPFALLHRGL